MLQRHGRQHEHSPLVQLQLDALQLLQSAARSCIPEQDIKPLYNTQLLSRKVADYTECKLTLRSDRCR